ncbi:hypothetical protein WE348_20940 (plasmid) [Alteromonas macleodii]|jgi:hypothetical protein|uniref:hypothetical protein n=1 Tax=Alteromonas macleodii TaxID=28108 RepID=UPI0030D2E5D3|tara:strand:- start:31197 stop:31952 length:756 start_codon:yes stop_codon:yes gene_type:complete
MNILRNVSFDAASEMKLQRFQKLAVKAFKRDKFVCQCCGFKSKKFMRILPFNGNSLAFDQRDYSSNEPASYKTVCTICYESNRLDFALTNGLGKIIYFPELSQNALNMIIHTHLNIVHEDTTVLDENVKKQINCLKNNIRIEFSILESREKALQDVFDASNSKALVGFLSRLTDSDYAKYRSGLFKDLRYLPDLDAYKPRALEWKKEAYKSIAISEWESVLEAHAPDLFSSWKKAFEQNSTDIMFPRLKYE